MKSVSEIERPAEQPLSLLESEAREKLCDEMARRFGQVAIRHRHGEIPQADYDRLHQVYFQKMNDGHIFEGEELESELAKFDQRVDSMWLLAQADIWDAKAELGCDTLPEYVSSPDQPLSNDELLHNNLALVEKYNKSVRAAGNLLLRAIAAEKEVDALLGKNRQLEAELAAFRQLAQPE